MKARTVYGIVSNRNALLEWVGLHFTQSEARTVFCANLVKPPMTKAECWQLWKKLGYRIVRFQATREEE